MRRSVIALLAVPVLLLGACGTQPQGGNSDPAQVDSVEQPEVGACRALTPDDVSRPANATLTVDCAEKHTAETFAVGDLPAKFTNAEYDAQDLSAWAYQTCSDAFAEHLGADESTVLRTILSWAWFRPSEKAWAKGARWYRCDVVGGSATSTAYAPLPESTHGLLAGRPNDRWMVCARGRSVPEGEKVPCSRQHDWRAVTTIKLGEEDDPYPGDTVVDSRTRAYCQKSISAWLNYPATFDFTYTYFHRAEWEAGNRRSVCWAQTDA
ncbi:hypothetical protein E8D34_14080 [Nocardioides sp. GY 10113]|uniref:septum formation family protein n=1 Tax=Nocardioides sp. GY 10113 TaxID=2569761 RepID=UPI0010A87C32|nr:septum formation family protein [Nocardioides sp. GY 10113]TIC84838.1 hypothetical protein E8D34_14080 [Nocardioides sp. GY 10113]